VSDIATLQPEPLARWHERLVNSPRLIRQGRLRRVSGMVLEVEGLPMPMGSHACIHNTSQGQWVDAECIGFHGDITYLMAFDPVQGLSPGAVVCPLDTPVLTGSSVG
jgi:flagellum-specific ATP synthase